MNKLQNSIRDLIKPMFDEYIHPQKGFIKRYSSETHYADVETNNPHGVGTIVLRQVPVQLTPGIHLPGPFPGDEVWITFTGGKLNLPKITSFGDPMYAVNTRELGLKHDRHGAYVPNTLSKEAKK